MAAGLLVLAGRMPARDANGRSTTGRIRVYENQTTTPVTVYSSSALSVALSQPIESDSAGQFPLIWIDSTNTPVTVAYEDDSGQTATYDGLTASTAAAAALVNAYAGAVSFTFSTTTTDADPGAGTIRFNNATIASVTEAYIDNTSSGGNTVTGWLDTFDDANTSTNRGTVALRSVTNQSVFALFTVTGSVTDGTGYRKVPVAYLSGSLPSNGEELVMGFAPAGPASAATITVGTTTAAASTASPSVANSGTSSAAVLDFTIPRAAPGGVLYVFDNPTTDSDPGAGKVRFNNATPASITSIYFDNADANGNTVTGWLDTFDDSTSTTKGTLTFRQLSNGRVITFDVTGSVVDGTGYRKVTVIHTAGSTLFDDDAEVSVTFDRTGDKGTDGEGSGDVTGPASATNNALAVYDGTTGKVLKDGPSYGTSGANKLLQLDASGKLPAVDGSQLTGLQGFGSAIGDIVLSANRQANSLRCNGAKYLKASYPALAAALGNIFDNTPATGSLSTLGRGYMQGACTDPSGLFGHYAAKSVDHGLIGNVSIYLQKSGSFGPALTTDILTSTGDQVLALATNTSFIVALCLNGDTGNRYLRYAQLDASGQITGAWANVTPAGLTAYANGFGVINGQFWLSYSVGGSATAPRIAHGVNPAALTVSTPTGSGAANDDGRGALMFFDGAEYIWWSGSYQLFRGAALSALARDAAITVAELPSNDLSGNSKQVRRPSYSRSGARCIFSLHPYNDTNPLYKVDAFGKTGQVTAFRAGNVSSWNYKSAAFAGEEVFCAYSATTYVFSRMDFATNDLIGPSSSSWSASGEMTLCGNLMIFGTSGPSYFVGASYDISTTFAVPNLPSPVGEHQIKAV